MAKYLCSSKNFFDSYFLRNAKTDIRKKKQMALMLQIGILYPEVK
jgi:hypothetical protein